MNAGWDSIRCPWAPARIFPRPSPRARPSCALAPPSSDRAAKIARGQNYNTSSKVMNITAAFVGGGNMGGALIRGLIARGLPPQNISVGEAHQARRISLADELGVHVTADNREAVQGADVVVLAV